MRMGGGGEKDSDDEHSDREAKVHDSTRAGGVRWVDDDEDQDESRSG